MERKLLSNSLLSTIRPVLPGFLILGIGMIMILHSGKRENFGPGWIGLFLPIVLIVVMVWLLFRRVVHPVYYDNNHLYYYKNGNEQIVAYHLVESYDIFLGWNSRGTIKYHDENGEIKSITFYLVRSQLVDKEYVLKEFEELVQSRQPGFKIIVRGHFKDRELQDLWP